LLNLHDSKRQMKMKNPIKLFPLFFMFVFHTSCGQNQTNSPKETIKAEPKHRVTSPGADARNFHTEYTYTDSTGKRLVIQNGFPRGGIKYTDHSGEVYVWAVFWARIINETDHPLELKIDFPVNSYEVPYLPGKYYKVLVPPDTMAIDKDPWFNNGQTYLKSFLDHSIHKPSSLRRTINPNESSGFYILILSLAVEGATGMMRTGFNLKGQNLFYRISRYSMPAKSLLNEKVVVSGSINLKNLILRKYQIHPL
jgi:hypothetical protein